MQEVIAACGDTCKLRISYEEDVHLMDLEFKVHRIGPHGTAYLANPWTHEHYEPAVSCNDLVMAWYSEVIDFASRNGAMLENLVFVDFAVFQSTTGLVFDKLFCH